MMNQQYEALIGLYGHPLHYQFTFDQLKPDLQSLYVFVNNKIFRNSDHEELWYIPSLQKIRAFVYTMEMQVLEDASEKKKDAFFKKHPDFPERLNKLLFQDWKPDMFFEYAAGQSNKKLEVIECGSVSDLMKLNEADFAPFLEEENTFSTYTNPKLGRTANFLLKKYAKVCCYSPNRLPDNFLYFLKNLNMVSL